MELVAGIRHVDLADDPAIFFGLGIDIDDGDVVGGLAVGVEGRDISDALRGAFMAMRGEG
jgi:hypothetical protein